jgi:hypothetical protein
LREALRKNAPARGFTPHVIWYHSPHREVTRKNKKEVVFESISPSEPTHPLIQGSLDEKNILVRGETLHRICYHTIKD